MQEVEKVASRTDQALGATPCHILKRSSGIWNWESRVTGTSKWKNDNRASSTQMPFLKFCTVEWLMQLLA